MKKIIGVIVLLCFTLCTSFNVYALDNNAGLSYEVVDNFAVITGYNGTNENIVIPSKIDGYNVTKINDKAFQNSAVKSVVIPDSVTAVGWRAFNNCKSLEKVKFGSNVAMIDSGAFYNCTSLKRLNLTNVKSIGSYAFSTCSSLASVDFGTKLEAIGDKAFELCKNLVYLYIPSTLSNVGYCSFDMDNSINEVYFEGTKSQWNSITINHTNDELTDKEIKYEHKRAKAGDVNLSGDVDISDATLIQAYLVGFSQFSEEQNIVADVNDSGDINISDVTVIQMYLAGRYSKFPID